MSFRASEHFDTLLHCFTLTQFLREIIVINLLLCRHVENAFLLKDTESNREFMKKFNIKAEENIPNKKTL